MQRDPLDHKALILEAYRIEGIGPEECRSIFLDWALSLPGDYTPQAAIARLLARYEPDHPDHPMTAVLREGQIPPPPPRRRGGWRRLPRD